MTWRPPTGVKLLTYAPHAGPRLATYRLRYRPRLWGAGIDSMEAYIEATSASEAVRSLREELRGLCEREEVVGIIE